VICGHFPLFLLTIVTSVQILLNWRFFAAASWLGEQTNCPLQILDCWENFFLDRKGIFTAKFRKPVWSQNCIWVHSEVSISLRRELYCMSKCQIIFLHVQYENDLDLDLDSTSIQVDALGHTPTPFWSVKSCHLCFFPGECHLSQIFLDCAYPVSSWSTWSSLETWNLPV